MKRCCLEIGLWSPDGRVFHRRLYRAIIVYWRFRDRVHGFQVQVGRSFWPNGKETA